MLLVVDNLFGQVTDTTIVSNNKTFLSFVIGKSTIADIEKKYGKYDTADTVVTSISHALLAGGECLSIENKKIIYSSLESKLIVVTETTNDTIRVFVIKDPLKVKTINNVILGKSIISELKLVDNQDKPRPSILQYLDKEIWYLKQGGIYYGYKSSKGIYNKKTTKKKITQIMLTGRN